MIINKNILNIKSKTTFKAVEIATHIPENERHRDEYFNIDFKNEDRVKAGEIFGLVPNPKNDTFSVQMWIKPNSFTAEFDYADKPMKKGKRYLKPFDVYIKGRKEGSKKFANLCKLMQNAVTVQSEDVKEPEKALKIIKEFFKVK